jgi:hypothetical protein
MERDIRDEIAEQDPAVGGRIDPKENDEMRPLEEGGQGYAEGFEQSEDDLIEAASHGDEAGDPVAERFPPEPESQLAGGVYGEPDEVDVTEVTFDPDEGREATGTDPHTAHDR